ncbi:MAG: tetratricopeptide repeat protein, partial [Deltaproteobacteria bacterium]|nr:tetratricopeptide repeat protein [Deltaproteobacteria bacterium]
QVRRLKAEQSRKLFQALFDGTDSVWTRIPGEVREPIDKAFRLDPWEALFMAASRAEDTSAMALFFSIRWDTPVRKTGDLFRHMIQFRSVFFDEEVLDHLLAGDVTVAQIIARANDQQTALRQCFSLCYSGMLAFAEEDRGPERLGVSATQEGTDPGQTVLFMVEREEPGAGPSRSTQFIGTRPALDAEAEEASAAVPEEPEEPEAAPGKPDTGRYVFPSAVWSGGSPDAAEPQASVDQDPPPPSPPVKREEAPSPSPPAAPASPAAEESGPLAAPAPGPEVGRATAYGTPVVAAPAPLPTPLPRVVRTPTVAADLAIAGRGGPATVDDVLKMALQEAEEAIERLGPEEAARLTQGRDQGFGGRAGMDFNSLMAGKVPATGIITTTGVSAAGPVTGRSPKTPPRPAPSPPPSPAGPAEPPPKPVPARPRADHDEPKKTLLYQLQEEDLLPGGFPGAKVPSTQGAAGGDLAPPSPAEELKAPEAVLALPPLPPRGLPQPETDEHVEELLAREYTSMRDRGFYAMFSLEPACQLSELRSAHGQLKARYSRASFRSYVLSRRAEEILGLINASIDRALSVLTSRGDRRIYDERNGISYTGGADETYFRLFDADEFFQQARRRMKMTHWVEAYNLLGRAADLNPLEADYPAFRAWALYQGFRAGQVRDDFAPPKARQLLDRALQIRDRNERALYYRARLERDLGKTDEAATYYARLLRINPHHPTAKDELKDLTRPEAAPVERSAARPRGGFWARVIGFLTGQR